MIFNARQEPSGLDPDDAPISDYRPQANFKYDATRGSQRLLAALLRTVPKQGRKRRTGQHTWQARLIKREGIRRVQNLAAQHFGITIDELTGPRGNREMSRRRQVAMTAARWITQASYPDLGECFNRDHTTVLYACEMIPVCDPDVIAIRDLMLA